MIENIKDRKYNTQEKSFNTSEFSWNLINNTLSKEQIKLLWEQIEKIISSNFLKKEYYPNKEDWSNEEITNIWKLTANMIRKRVEEWKWIFYMNPCLPQTLYFISILKKSFPDLKNKINLCIEILSTKERWNLGIHAFTKINISDKQQIIINYSRDNNVYIHSWCYENKLWHNTKKIISIPANNFDENDNIFDIAKKYFYEIEKKENNKWFTENEIKKFENMYSSLIKKLSLDNTFSNFETRNEKHSELIIHNELTEEIPESIE